MPTRTISVICLILAVFYHTQPVLAADLSTGEEETVTETSVQNFGPAIRVLLGTIKQKTAVEVLPGESIVIDNFPVPIETTSTISFTLNKGKITVKKGSSVLGTGTVVRLNPTSLWRVTEIVGFGRRLGGHRADYNQYRGKIEWRVSKNAGTIALINILPLEQYVWGLGESAPRDPDAFLKALVVAARSYAYVRLGNKRLSYDVQATTNDQLYLGYEAELRLPEVRLAAEATSGEVVYYDGSPVTTPYFSRSNGTTLSWDQSHKNKQPWLVAVEALYDVGGKRSGHGYGMSLHDAKARVQKDEWTYGQVLTYFYSGTTVQTGY